MASQLSRSCAGFCRAVLDRHAAKGRLAMTKIIRVRGLGGRTTGAPFFQGCQDWRWGLSLVWGYERAEPLGLPVSAA